MGANYLSINPIHHTKIKHMIVHYHFVGELVANKTLEVKFVCSKDQLANILTKPLAKSIFHYLRNKLIGTLPYESKMIWEVRLIGEQE